MALKPFLGAGQIPVKAVATSATPITLSDTAVIDPPFDAIYVGTTGDITIDSPNNGTNITFRSVPVGFFPVSAKRVYNAGTTAGNLVGLNW